MSFVKFLQGIGDRLGILETVETPGSPQAVRIQTRSVSIRELASEIKAGEIRMLADSPAEFSVPFEKICETAGISSNPQDWTIERLRQVLSNESMRDKSREEIQKTVLDLLKSEGVPAEKIVKDAMARDQAMDSYEDFIREKMQARRESGKKRLAEIECSIRDLQDESKTLGRSLESDEERWREWKKHKRAKEREFATLLGYIVDHAVITLDDKD